jgi:hypothetical protein
MVQDAESPEERSGPDRRDYPRFRSNRVVTFMKEDGSEVKSISRILNVSQGGLQFASRDPIAPDTVLRMDIAGTHDQRPITLSARVIWMSPEPDASGWYYSGVAFLDIADDARAVVLKAVAQDLTSISS